MFEGLKPITLCDKFICFGRCQLETETLRKACCITFYCLIESNRLDLVQFGKVAV